MIKLRFKRFSRSSSKLSNTGAAGGSCSSRSGRLDISRDQIEWELRPGGMLVQKREDGGSSRGGREDLITVRVVLSNGSRFHDISIEATSTFGELKVMLAMVSGLEPREQRVVFKGKERDDGDHLHMVGVRDMDKMLLLQDPAIKESKMRHINSLIHATMSTVVGLSPRNVDQPAAACRTVISV